jgi:DNA-binding response OmpR family regulator
LRVYLVEDDYLKADRLQIFIKERYQNAEINIYGSFQSGLRAIQSNPPQLVILDMTLPTFDRTGSEREGRLRPLGGFDLMKKLVLHNIEVPIVVVSQLETFGEGSDRVTFKELVNKCHREFPNIFRGAVYFNQTDSSWICELQSLIV